MISTVLINSYLYLPFMFEIVCHKVFTLFFILSRSFTSIVKYSYVRWQQYGMSISTPISYYTHKPRLQDENHCIFRFTIWYFLIVITRIVWLIDFKTTYLLTYKMYMLVCIIYLEGKFCDRECMKSFIYILYLSYNSKRRKKIVSCCRLHIKLFSYICV